MKEVEVIRNLDPMGRLVIPLPIREALGLNPKDPVRIQVRDDSIVIRPLDNRCCLCNIPLEPSGGIIAVVEDKQICVRCAKSILDATLKMFQDMANQVATI